MRSGKRTLRISVLFCAWTLPGFYTAPVLASCPPSHINETARVQRVHDGDTVRLSDGRKVRLIGINTPELARDNTPAQPYAIKARDALDKLLKRHDYQVSLSYGVDRKDKYRRTLAHLYLPDNENVQAFLLQNGYATAFTTPPNDRMADCYRQAESRAINKRRGIWALPDYQVLLPEQLGKKARGFRRIEGRVGEVRQSKKALWIYLPLNTRPGHLKVRIARKDLYNFNLHDLQQLVGKNIRLRGWLHPDKTGFFMNLRHPSSLSLLTK